MIFIKLYGKQANIIAKKLEEKGLFKPYNSGKAEIDVHMMVICRSVEGHSVAELSFEV